MAFTRKKEKEWKESTSIQWGSDTSFMDKNCILLNIILPCAPQIFTKVVKIRRWLEYVDLVQKRKEGTEFCIEMEASQGGTPGPGGDQGSKEHKENASSMQFSECSGGLWILPSCTFGGLLKLTWISEEEETDFWDNSF